MYLHGAIRKSERLEVLGFTDWREFPLAHPNTTKKWPFWSAVHNTSLHMLRKS